MKRKNHNLLFLCILLSSCTSLSPVFIDVVHDHRQLTTETGNSLIASIDEAIALETNESERQALIDLKERIQVISRQAVVMDEYILKKLSDEELALYIRSKWRMSP